MKNNKSNSYIIPQKQLLRIQLNDLFQSRNNSLNFGGQVLGLQVNTGFENLLVDTSAL
jgi:hypothetical protein